MSYNIEQAQFRIRCMPQSNKTEPLYHIFTTDSYFLDISQGHVISMLDKSEENVGTSILSTIQYRAANMASPPRRSFTGYYFEKGGKKENGQALYLAFIPIIYSNSVDYGGIWPYRAKE